MKLAALNLDKVCTLASAILLDQLLSTGNPAAHANCRPCHFYDPFAVSRGSNQYNLTGNVTASNSHDPARAGSTTKPPLMIHKASQPNRPIIISSHQPQLKRSESKTCGSGGCMSRSTVAISGAAGGSTVRVTLTSSPTPPLTKPASYPCRTAQTHPATTCTAQIGLSGGRQIKTYNNNDGSSTRTWILCSRSTKSKQGRALSSSSTTSRSGSGL